MFAIKLRIPRIIYINSKVESDDKDFIKVGKLLPRNRKVHNLYKWETSEDTFQEKFHSITYNHLLSSNIEGIYETKMPLKFRAINELGCLIKPRKNKIQKHEQALGRIYSIDELEMKNHTMNSSPYLPSGSFEKLYLLHSNQTNKHVFGFFCFSTKQIHITIVNPAGPKKQENVPAEIAAMKNAMAKQMEEIENSLDFIEWEVLTNNVYNELKTALLNVERQFAD